MRTSAYIITILFLISTSYAEKDIRGLSLARWVVERNSSLNIQGETNINSFQCDVTEYLRADTLFYWTNDASRKLNFTNSSLSIEVKRFDCHNKFISEDFRTALKADKNPNLKITFISMDQFSPNCNNQQVRGIVDIELAHVIKRSEIIYTAKSLTGNRIQLTGNHLFQFSDFNLKPPRKLAGLIRTKDQIKVSFQLIFRSI